jgi:ATP synthase protein I
MTTDPQPVHSSAGPGPKTTTVGAMLRRAALATVAVGVVLVILGAVVSGPSALVGAAIGTAMVVVFFGLGAVVVNMVAAVSPAASLLVALLTYTLEVVLVGLVFLGLRDSGALATTVAGPWLAAAVIGATLTWTTAQIVAATRARQPVYDLPPVSKEAGAR